MYHVEMLNAKMGNWCKLKKFPSGLLSVTDKKFKALIFPWFLRKGPSNTHIEKMARKETMGISSSTYEKTWITRKYTTVELFRSTRQEGANDQHGKSDLFLSVRLSDEDEQFQS